MILTRKILRQLIIESVTEDLRDRAYRQKIQNFIDTVLNDQELFDTAIAEYSYQINNSAEYNDGRVLDLDDVYINCRDFGLEDGIKAEYFDTAFGGLDDMVGPYQDEMGDKFEPHDPNITDYSEFMMGKMSDAGLGPDQPVEVGQPLPDLESKEYEAEWARRANKLGYQRQKEKDLGVDQMLDRLSTYLTNYTILQMNRQGLIDSDDMFLFKRISNDINAKHMGKIHVKK